MLPRVCSLALALALVALAASARAVGAGFAISGPAFAARAGADVSQDNVAPVHASDENAANVVACSLTANPWRSVYSLCSGDTCLAITETFQFYDNLSFELDIYASFSSNTGGQSCSSNTVYQSGTYTFFPPTLNVNLQSCYVSGAGCITCGQLSSYSAITNFAPDCSYVSVSIQGSSPVIYYATSSGLSGGAIAGIIIGVLVGVGILVAVVLVARKRAAYQPLA